MAHVEAYQCDRCGSLFSEKISALVPMKSGGHNYVRLYKVSGANGPADYKFDVDLCPNCVNSLVDWFAGYRLQN